MFYTYNIPKMLSIYTSVVAFFSTVNASELGQLPELILPNGILLNLRWSTTSLKLGSSQRLPKFMYVSSPTDKGSGS